AQRAGLRAAGGRERGRGARPAAGACRRARPRRRRRRRGRASGAVGDVPAGGGRARGGAHRDAGRMMDHPLANGAREADALTIAGRTLRSRLLLGTGGFVSLELLSAAVAARGTEMVAVALRRVDPGARGSLIDTLADAGVMLLPNTAGCHTARDAVVTAKLAREAFATDWVKLEVIGDEDTL